MTEQLIVYEDQDIIVIHKPAGLATQTARLGERDVVSELKNYLARSGKITARNKPDRGEPYVGMVHRLDQPVEGLLVFAKSREAAAELSKQMTDRTMSKDYYALVLGKPEKTEGELKNFLRHDARNNRTYVAALGESPENSKMACLQYAVRSYQDKVTLLDIRLETGRHHQIRVQLSHAGMPLLGDERYGSAESQEISRRMNCHKMALCAYRLKLVHPRTGAKKIYETEPVNQVFSSFFTNF